jgi:hypothetical protein
MTNQPNEEAIMKKKMAILALTIALGVTLPMSADCFVPQEVNFFVFGGFSGSISFAGGNNTLVGDLPNLGMEIDYWLRRGEDQPVRFYLTAEFQPVNITFETGPRIGTDYDFGAGGFFKIDYVSPSPYPALSGFFEDAHVDGSGLLAHLHCDTIAHNPGGGIGFLQIDFLGAGVAPDPFTMTSFQEFRLFASPIPGTVVLLGSSLLGLAGWRGFRKS